MNAKPWPVTNEIYHADSANSVSNGELKTFAESPAEYFLRHIAKDPSYKVQSDAMAFGSRLHEKVFEGRESFAVTETTNRSKEGRSFREVYPDAVTSEEYELLMDMHAAILRDPDAKRLLEAEGITEQPIRWDDDLTAMACRCKPDKLACGCIVDLKSTSCKTLKAWAWESENKWFYHRQAAWYQTGVHELTGDALRFLFIVASKVPPHPVWVVELAENAIDLGHLENRFYLSELAKRRDSGFWGRHEPAGIIKVPYSKWAGVNAEAWRT